MTSNSKIFERVNYVAGLSNNNRNMEERSLYNICEHLIALCLRRGRKQSFLLDIGCGTGRFSIPIAQRGQNITVTCLDSSENMLDVLKNSARHLGVKNIEIVLENFEDWQPLAKYSVVFMSALIHLLDDKPAAFRKVSSLQRSGDYFVLRTPFKDQIERVDVYKWLPEALEIYRKSHPTLDDIQALARNSGYVIDSVKEYLDVKFLSREKFLDVYYEKKHSAFWQIPEWQFQARLSEIEEKTRDLVTIRCSSGTSLVTMQKRS